MHRGHDHDHHHHGNGAAAGHNHAAPPRAVQWQTPHLPHDHEYEDHHHHHEPDLDLVEMAFVEGFAATKDPASFLRLARIPFEATDGNGAKLVLLRVESGATTDVGALSPQLGGGGMCYDPLPARMVTHRRALGFVYFDGQVPRVLSLEEVRGLTGPA